MFQGYLRYLLFSYSLFKLECSYDRHVVSKTVEVIVVTQIVQCLDLYRSVRVVDVDDLVYHFTLLSICTIVV